MLPSVCVIDRGSMTVIFCCQTSVGKKWSHEKKIARFTDSLFSGEICTLRFLHGLAHPTFRKSPKGLHRAFVLSSMLVLRTLLYIFLSNHLRCLSFLLSLRTCIEFHLCVRVVVLTLIATLICLPPRQAPLSFFSLSLFGPLQWTTLHNISCLLVVCYFVVYISMNINNVWFVLFYLFV